MRRCKRSSGLEINLTPLLDVLFSILFIVMLTSQQNEDSLRAETQEQAEQIEQIKQQAAVYENQMKSYDLYHTEAILITLSNVQENRNHKLIVSEGLKEKELETIYLGLDKTENTKNRLNNQISDMMENTNNQPIYIVFHCNKSCIYTDEYKAIIAELDNLQKNNKEVFYKIIEGED